MNVDVSPGRACCLDGDTRAKIEAVHAEVRNRASEIKWWADETEVYGWAERNELSESVGTALRLFEALLKRI